MNIEFLIYSFTFVLRMLLFGTLRPRHSSTRSFKNLHTRAIIPGSTGGFIAKPSCILEELAIELGLLFELNKISDIHITINVKAIINEFSSIKHNNNIHEGNAFNANIKALQTNFNTSVIFFNEKEDL